MLTRLKLEYSNSGSWWFLTSFLAASSQTLSIHVHGSHTILSLSLLMLSYCTMISGHCSLIFWESFLVILSISSLVILGTSSLVIICFSSLLCWLDGDPPSYSFILALYIHKACFWNTSLVVLSCCVGLGSRQAGQHKRHFIPLVFSPPSSN